MEIFELQYFLGVASEENIHRASEKLHVSPASLSKAIARLEDELSVKLFSREGRNIRLTDHGRLFQNRAAEIVNLADATKLELAGHKGAIHVIIAGAEVLLSEMGVMITKDLKRKFPKISFEYHAVNDDEALLQVSRGEAHLALVTSNVPDHFELSKKIISEVQFQTVVGENHPLYSLARSKKTVSIEKVLECSFVSPNHPLLGKVGLKQSFDGWRDDQFPRKVEYLTSSLKILEELVLRGQALAYLPDYYAKRLGLLTLKILGCPYSCTQKVYLVAKNPKDRSWMNQWF